MQVSQTFRPQTVEEIWAEVPQIRALGFVKLDGRWGNVTQIKGDKIGEVTLVIEGV